MKQPELGVRLTELRKSKNLTQEELVDACHVSVRTIQRIESGEVTPRTSTVKIILAALGEDLKSFHTGNGSGDSQLLRMENGLQIAWIAGVIYFFSNFLIAGLDYMRWEMGDDDIPILFYISSELVYLVTYVLFIGGIIQLATYFENPILKVASYLLIILTGLIVVFDIATLIFPIEDEMYLAILPAQSIGVGAIGLVFGIGLIKLQDGMGRMALLAGVFELMIGFFFITVILFLLGFIFLIPATIIEIVVLYRGYEYVKGEREKA